MTVPINELLTLSEAATALGKTTVRVWQLIREKKIKGIRRGIWFVYPDSLRAYIAADEAKKASKKSEEKS